MRTPQEKKIAGHFYGWKMLCKRREIPFDVTIEQWLQTWREHPDSHLSGYIVKRDANAEWSASNIMFMAKPVRAKAGKPGARVLTVRQWLRELRAQV